MAKNPLSNLITRLLSSRDVFVQCVKREALVVFGKCRAV